MADKKKRGFLSKIGFKSKDEKLALDAAEKAAAQKQIDAQMAARMASINAAALASARAQDTGAAKMSDEERVRIEVEEKRQAEIQAARDVERAKQLAEETARREADKVADAERAAEDTGLESERLAEDARPGKERGVAEDAAAAKRLEDERLARLAREADEAERRSARAADRKAREQAERDERERLAEERREQRIKAGLSPEPEPELDVTAEGGFLDRISKGLRRSTSRMSDQMAASFTQRTLDRDALEDLEDILIMADLGSDVAETVSRRLAEDKFDKQVTDLEIKVALAETISDILTPLETPFVLGLARPQVILFVGVNGSGKTTTLGKIAKRFGDQGKRVLICAADTFRAAAVEQLTVWGERAGAPVMSGKPGADAASLVFDAMSRARDEDYDILMIDTAGRLQNRTELMDELAKIIRVIEKTDPSAPHHSVLVLDATVGQNALSQVEAFRDTAKVSGLIMTKLDGTAKGGVLVALSEKYKLPIHFIGIGEAIEDLEPFSGPVFAAALSGVADAVSG